MKYKYVMSLLVISWTTLFYGVKESTSLTDDELEEQLMEISVHDLLTTSAHEEPRFFGLNLRPSYNTSVAFTMPCFVFTIPDNEGLGLGVNSFGVIAFISMFLLAGLAVFVYTIDHEDRRRSLSSIIQYNEGIMSDIFDVIFNLPDVVDFENCAKLSVCAAHGQSEKYGLLAWPFTFFVQGTTSELNQTHLTSYERAAVLGTQRPFECPRRYPCVVHPLDVALFVKDYYLK